MATTIVSKRLRTQLEVATARTNAAARQAKEAARREEWAKRLDAASYSCHREADVWIAEGPAGQRFEFRRGIQWAPGHYTVHVESHTGGRYEISVDHDLCHCDCPAAMSGNAGGGCKHLCGWAAIKQAHLMAKQLAVEPKAA